MAWPAPALWSLGCQLCTLLDWLEMQNPKPIPALNQNPLPLLGCQVICEHFTIRETLLWKFQSQPPCTLQYRERFKTLCSAIMLMGISCYQTLPTSKVNFKGEMLGLPIYSFIRENSPFTANNGRHFFKTIKSSFLTVVASNASLSHFSAVWLYPQPLPSDSSLLSNRLPYHLLC